MDPVTAIGLATSVAQLVEVSWKIVSKSHEIYRNGALPEYRDTQTVTADLQKINEKLLHFLNNAETVNDLDEDDVALRQLCTSSNKIATELVKRLSIVNPGDEYRSWKSIRQALKSVWIKSELDETAARLQTYRTQLNTRILVSLRDRVDSISESNKNIASSISESRVLFNTNQEIQTDFLTRFILSENEKTRKLLAELAVAGVNYPVYPSLTGRMSPIPSRPDLKEDIFTAVEEGNIPKLRRILREDPSAIFAFNSTGQTVLHIAAGKADIDMITYLLRNGAKINPDDDEGRLPLHYAVEVGSEPVVRSLVAKGADIYAKDTKGRAPHEISDPSSLISWIFTRGANLEAKDGTGSTALYHFAQRGDLDSVRILLDQGADTEAICWAHKTPIFPACDGGFVDIVELLLARGADVHKRDERQTTPLGSTGWHGHTRIGELLLDHGAHIDAFNQHNFAAIHECCDHDKEDMALMLLNRGAQFEIPNQFGYCPIHQAAMHGHTELVREMLDRGGNINILNSKAHWTALAEACEHGHLPIVQLLLARGANTEEWTGTDRKTALIRAAEHGYTEIVKSMLEGQAKLDAADKEGKTALYCAVVGGHAQTTQFLLSQRPNVNVQDPRKYTPLCRAAQARRLDLVQLLLDAGANVNHVNADGWSPLEESSHYGKHEINSALIRYGADVDSQDNNKYTPLHRAAQGGYVEAAIILLDKGKANIDAQNKDGWTSLHEACWYGYLELVKALLQRGAGVDIRNKRGNMPLALAKDRRHSHVIAVMEEFSKGGDGWEVIGLP